MDTILDGWKSGFESCKGPGRMMVLESAKRQDEKLYLKLVKALELDLKTVERILK